MVISYGNIPLISWKFSAVGSRSHFNTLKGFSLFLRDLSLGQLLIQP